MARIDALPGSAFAKIVVKLALTFALVLVAVRAADFASVLRYFHAPMVLPALAAVFLLALLSVLHTVRWNAILATISGRHFPFGIVSSVVLSSYFFGQILPFSVGGDAMRVWWSRKQELGLAAAFNSVVLDRVTALVGIAVLMTLTAPLMLQTVAASGPMAGLLLAVAGIYVGGAVLCLIPKFGGGLKNTATMGKFVRLGEDAWNVFSSPRALVATIGASAIVHACVALVFFLLAAGMGIALSPLQCIVLIPPVILVSTLPITIAGWGLREGAMIFSLGFVGVPPDAALALSVMFGLASLVVGLIGGVVWLFKR